VEVHRVSEFSFRPLGEESEPVDEADGREKSGTKEGDKEYLAGKITSSSPRLGPRSVWNVDGELITHPAIDVKYDTLRFLFSVCNGGVLYGLIWTIFLAILIAFPIN